MTEFTTNRHLRHKLQSLERRLDELEEASNKLQKAEDELMDLQDKIIQAEGSNSSLLSDVEALRKRVLKIEGKDEEVRKAEDLCRLIKEQLKDEENLTKELRAEIEHLQSRMTELEKLEEAFGKCKSDCTQVCLNLNEEKNLTKKLSSELDALKARVKEVDSSEARLNKAEQALNTEMEKLKVLTQTFVMERKKLLEKQKEDEKMILKLTEKLECQTRKLGLSDHRFNESHDLYIEDNISAGLSGKLTPKKSLDYVKLSGDSLKNKSENEKNSFDGQEDNKVRDLTQEVENLKCRLKQLEMVEEDLKNMESKNSEMEEKFQQEKSRSQALRNELEQLKIQHLSGSGHGNLLASSTTKVLENGKPETGEVNTRGGFRQEKLKYKGAASAESVTSRYKNRDISTPLWKPKSKELSQTENSPKLLRRAQSPTHRPKKSGLKSASSNTSENRLEDGKNVDEKPASVHQVTSNASNDSKKVSVLSRYPPAAGDQKPQRASAKPGCSESKKHSGERFSRLHSARDCESNGSNMIVNTANKTVSLSPVEKDLSSEPAAIEPPREATTLLSMTQANGCYTAYRAHLRASGSSDHGSEGQSIASETESTGSKHLVGELDTGPLISVFSRRSSDSKQPTYSCIQDSHSGRSSTRSSYDEEQHRSLMSEGGYQEPLQMSTGIEIQRVCSPREAIRSKVVIKPAITEYNKKEVMSGEPLPLSDRTRTSTKPNKMTSSITFYPNDPNTSRTSSRSSSVSSDTPSKERHTSTSNIVIGPSPDLRGSFTIPYEISIPKSEITLRPSEENSYNSDPPSVLDSARIETSILSRSSFNLQPLEMASELNETEPEFQSSTSISTPSLASWRNNSNHHRLSLDNNAPDVRNVTVRSPWRNRGVTLDQPAHDGVEEESESATTWRAYRATTVVDSEEALSPHITTRSAKPSPAELYMQRISSGRDSLESVRRTKSVALPFDSALHRSIPHEPVSAQLLQVRSWKEPTAVGEGDLTPTSWKKQTSNLDSSEHLRGQGPWLDKSLIDEGSHPWNNRHLDN